MRKIVLLIIPLFFFLHSWSLKGTFENDSIPYSAHLLSRYIKHESVTGNERVAGIFFSTIARQKGFHVEILTDDPGSYNFTASLYPLESGKPNIILLNHIDVVPAGKSGEYTHPPFSGAIADGYVWGRGALDMKGMAVMQLLAMTFY
jgi:carboxypeptidase PM20D1